MLIKENKDAVILTGSEKDLKELKTKFKSVGMCISVKEAPRKVTKDPGDETLLDVGYYKDKIKTLQTENAVLRAEVDRLNKEISYIKDNTRRLSEHNDELMAAAEQEYTEQIDELKKRTAKLERFYLDNTILK